MKQKITEEMGIQKEWKAEAKDIQVQDIQNFIGHLVNDYEHDYGTIVHAMEAGMLAVLNAMNKSEQGGITGFQAGCLGWSMIQEFFGTSEIGRRLTKYDDMLYPQYENKFKTITADMWERIQETAKKNLEESPEAHREVVAHWKSIIDGNIPFGFSIEE